MSSRTEEEKKPEEQQSNAMGDVIPVAQVDTWKYRCHHDQQRLAKNDLFETYYRDLQLVAPKGEKWDTFSKLMRSALPTTVWLNDTDIMAHELARQLANLGPDVISPIPWYPIPGMAWRVHCTKEEFRKAPTMQPLRQLFMKHTAMGTMNRQEEVSMIPPLLLDLKSTDVCLDMCAAPGSKTAQLLVALGRQKMGNADSPFPFDYLSSGCVVANELDCKRASMLVHQVKRLSLLFPFALFTNHDARFFPDTMRYDKILLDVVCSGDGTIRKAPFIIQRWKPSMGHAMHGLQLQIALRAAHLLKVGGRMVYSTCSLNPVEDEAVITHLIAQTNGAMALVDGRSVLPKLPCDPGLTKWVVVNNKGTVQNAASNEIPKTCFPLDPMPSGLDLTKCMRLLPQHCNGGAFFVAVLEKVAPFDMGKIDASNITGGNREKKQQQSKSTKGEGGETPVTPATKEPKDKVASPVYHFAPCEITDVLEKFYEIPKFPTDHIVVRSHDSTLKVSKTDEGQREGNANELLKLGISTHCNFVSNTVKDVISETRKMQLQQQAMTPNKIDEQEGSSKSPKATTDNICNGVDVAVPLNIVAAGLRILAHERMDGTWRVVNESAPLFPTLMKNSSRLVHCTTDDILQLLEEGGAIRSVHTDDIKEASLREKVTQLPNGHFLLMIRHQEELEGKKEDVSSTTTTTVSSSNSSLHAPYIPAIAMRARAHFQLFVNKEDIAPLQLRLGMKVTGPMEEGEGDK